MGVVIDADVLDVGKVVQVEAERLSIKRCAFIVEVLVVEVVEGLFIVYYIVYIWRRFPLLYKSRLASVCP